MQKYPQKIKSVSDIYLAPETGYDDVDLCLQMQMWREIESQFNASAEVERTYDQLRELWKRLKIAMKKELEVFILFIVD